ncbi:type II toxin-antitoxin system HipA family toxin [Thalassospira sp. CH_XMU1420-2]|uniref:type II toxin-antitoxin system HipA family toxin n=1 Tax=Thalassospira sp. CH_XMU1420-2 TaxID=3107769 RepID=UPI0030085C2F
MTRAEVKLWGATIGAVSWNKDLEVGEFEYLPVLTQAGVQPAPIMMPVGRQVYSFPGLGKDAFKGLPGMLADSLPDKFGNLLIDKWLTEQGRSTKDFNPVERLCYVGTRGMGALEFIPARTFAKTKDRTLDIEKLTELASKVLIERTSIKGKLTGHDDEEALRDILRVGTSAGGARAKAVLLWNEETGEFRSGHGRHHHW